MQIDVAFKHMPVSDKLRDYAREKSEKLGKYFDGKIHAAWNFTIEREQRIAHCHVTGNHMDYFGEASSTDFEASIEQAIDKIEKQVKRRKEIVKDKLHRNAGAKAAAAESGEKDEVSEAS